jgi:hypothetical protein
MSILRAGLGRALWTLTEQVQLHHSDFAAASELQIRNLERWRAFDGCAACAWELHGDLFRIRVEHN